MAQNGTAENPHSGHGTPIPLDALSAVLTANSGGTTTIEPDPAFPPPTDPLGANAPDRAKLIYRDLPIVTVQNSWSVAQTRGALAAHMVGTFEGTGQLVDSQLGDDRVQATLGSRISGLFGRPVRFKAGNASDDAAECLKAWQKWWPQLARTSSLSEMAAYGIFMGFSPGQLCWDTSGEIWGPYLRPWHPRYTYYDWSTRKYIALSQDGAIPIIAGDGKWVMHAPFGEYRGWIRGAVRSVAEPWLIRHFAIRDWARFSEVHGMPIRKAICPAAADPSQRSNFEAALSSLGTETTILIPQGVDRENGGNSYDLELLEATDTAWESFPGLIDRCDMSIVLAILFQNLTTEVKGGSFAATSAHMDIRQGGIEFDNEAWKTTIYTQIARPFAYLNFGDADLAPWTDWDVTPLQDYENKAKQFLQLGTAVEMLRRGGVEFIDVEQLRKYAASQLGLDGLPDFKIVPPVSASGAMGK